MSGDAPGVIVLEGRVGSVIPTDLIHSASLSVLQADVLTVAPAVIELPPLSPGV